MNEQTSPETSSTPTTERFESVIHASPDVVVATIQTQISKLQELGVNSNLPEWRREEAKRQMLELGAADKYAREWQRSIAQAERSGRPSLLFSEFMDRTLDDALGIDEEKPILDKIISTRDWVGGEQYVALVGDMLQVEQESHESSTHETTHGSSTNKQIEDITPEDAQSVEQTRQSIEALYDNEFLDTVVGYAKNRTQVFLCLVDGLGQRGDDSRGDAQAVFIPANVTREARKEQDWRKHLNEAVVFSSIVEPDLKPVIKERQVKGKFGRMTTETYTVQEAVPGSERAVMTKNEKTGQDEPLVRFRYHYFPSDKSIRSEQLPAYREFVGGREGASLTAKIDLPKSMADELKDKIQRNPEEARLLAEKLVLSNTNGAVSEEYWQKGGSSGNPVRPPYEGLPPDWAITMMTGKETMQYGRSHVLDYRTQDLAV